MARPDAAGWGHSGVWNRTDRFLRFKPEPLPGYPDLLVTLVIDTNSIHAQEHKTHFVKDWPQPENSKDIRGFQGLTSHCRPFIEHNVHSAMPLNAIGTPPKGHRDMARQCGALRRVRHTPFTWDSECQHAVDTLRKALCDAPVHAAPDPEDTYCLHVNASQDALGAALSHVQD